MSYYFFFSYARANNDEFLRLFFNDLSGKICEKEGLDPEKAKVEYAKPDKKMVGFFDQQDLELGAQWDTRLAQALQDSPVLVSIYSPAYFLSQYCGKEWEFFYRRRSLHPALPPVIKPVIWVPLGPRHSPPAKVGGPQYFVGDPRAVHNTEGLKKMRKQYANYEVAYDAFIEKLADEILDARYKLTLPPLNPLPLLSAIDSAFHPPPTGAAPPPSPPPVGGGGPTSALFVVVAANPNQFAQNARTQSFYLQSGGVEWKPYHPDVPIPLISLAQAEAGNLGIVSYPVSFNQIPFNQSLPQVIRDAEQNGSLVILFVDGWTAELPQYQQMLQSFDQNNYKNCSVIIPWNEKDPETLSRGPLFKQLVRDTVFPFWSRLASVPDQFYFRDTISTVEELRDQLRDTLRKLQPKVAKEVLDHAKKEDIQRRIESDIEKPSLAHRAADGVAP